MLNKPTYNRHEDREDGIIRLLLFSAVMCLLFLAFCLALVIRAKSYKSVIYDTARSGVPITEMPDTSRAVRLIGKPTRGATYSLPARPKYPHFWNGY